MRAWTPFRSRDGVVLHRDDDVVRRLVVPALLLLVPEHPEVAEVTEEARDEADDESHERPAVADVSAGVEVDHTDPQYSLAEGLAGRAALEIDEVRDVADDPQDVREHQEPS